MFAKLRFIILNSKLFFIVLEKSCTFIRKPQWKCCKFAPKNERAFLRAFGGEKFAEMKKMLYLCGAFTKGKTLLTLKTKKHGKPN